VAELARDGHDTEQARLLLAQFEELLALHVVHRAGVGYGVKSSAS
jgi:hypothetical protein